MTACSPWHFASIFHPFRWGDQSLPFWRPAKSQKSQKGNGIVRVAASKNPAPGFLAPKTPEAPSPSPSTPQSPKLYLLSQDRISYPSVNYGYSRTAVRSSPVHAEEALGYSISIPPHLPSPTPLGLISLISAVCCHCTPFHAFFVLPWHALSYLTFSRVETTHDPWILIWNQVSERPRLYIDCRSPTRLLVDAGRTWRVEQAL